MSNEPPTQPDTFSAKDNNVVEPHLPSSTHQSIHSVSTNVSILHHGEKKQDAETAKHEQRPQLDRTLTNASNGGPPHSIFTTNQKRFIVFMASWGGFFSPVSGQIYFPALNSLARDLHVSNSLINLTLTSYMIFQGLAPSIIGALADTTGRRVAYACCFIPYIGANIGLALQNSYAALFVLRCIQSSGSSGTIAMASGVVADIATAAERGSYMGYTLAGSLLGPAIGPVLGGILSQFLGWRAIFWFLMIMGSTFLIIFAIFFPETARSQVGNGSIPPRGINMSLLNYLAVRKARQDLEKPTDELQNEASLPPKRKTGFPNPLSSLKMLLDRENALLLFYNAFLFAAFYDITATIPSQFSRIYGFNDLQIGLCYIPFGCGSLCAALLNGQFLDRNFRRWCQKLGVEIKKGRNNDLANFPIEKVRLQIAIPAAYVCASMVLIFGWVLNFNGPLAVLLIVLFFTSLTMSIAFNCTSTLLVDFYPKQPATATAANNLTRCLLGAGATAAVVPMVDALGIGWTFTVLGLGLWITSPMLWWVYFRGMEWRKKRSSIESEKRKQDGSVARNEQNNASHDEIVEENAIVEQEKEAIGSEHGRKSVKEREPLYLQQTLARTMSHQSNC